MRVSPPLWLNPPLIRRLPCKVISKLEPQGYVVEVSIDGEERSVVVPEETLEIKGEKLPAEGNLLVVVLAELPDDKRLLTELPATPLTGSQRIKIDPGVLLVA